MDGAETGPNGKDDIPDAKVLAEIAPKHAEVTPVYPNPASPAPVPGTALQTDPTAQVPSPALLTPEEETFVSQVQQKWHGMERDHLLSRHTVGMMLNQHLGAPTQRYPRGKYVIQGIVERLGISQSNVSRMRCFADRFADLKALQDQFPEVDNWTKVKAILPGLPKADSKGDRKRTPRQSPVRKNALRQVVKKLKGWETDLEAFKQKLAAEVQDELVQLVENVKKFAQHLQELSLKQDQPAVKQNPKKGPKGRKKGAKQEAAV